VATGITFALEVKDYVPNLMKSLNLLAAREVAVGWPMDKNKPRKDGDPMNNATLGYVLSVGSGARNLPPRPMLEPGIKEGSEAITAQLKNAGVQAMNGNTTGVEKALTAVGVVAVSAVRLKIEKGPFTSLAASTLAARRRAGCAGTLPLQRTGQMRNAVSMTVRKRKG
jgi:hypothetical protein